MLDEMEAGEEREQSHSKIKLQDSDGIKRGADLANCVFLTMTLQSRVACSIAPLNSTTLVPDVLFRLPPPSLSSWVFHWVRCFCRVSITWPSPNSK